MDDDGYSYERDGETVKVSWREVAESHIEAWNQVLSGDVWGYVLERREHCEHCGHTEWTDVDSCWGFYGFDNCKEEGLSVANGYKNDTTNQ